MNLLALKRSIEHLQVLLAIRSDDDEDELALLLLALLSIWFEDEDNEKFHQAFLQTLESFYLALLVGMVGETTAKDYQYLITKELAVQEGYLNGFISDLASGKTSDAQARARAKQYTTSLGKLGWQAELTLAGDKILEWRYNPEAMHCGSCIELDEQRKPASTWMSLNLYPKSPLLECSQSCRCVLVPV